ATGALTLQREHLFVAPTYAFVGASTLTTAINVEIASPIAGTNATLTNSHALRVVASAAAHVPLVVNGAASQTGKLTSWQVNGTEKASITSDGRIILDPGGVSALSIAFTGALISGFIKFLVELLWSIPAHSSVQLLKAAFEIFRVISLAGVLQVTLQQPQIPGSFVQRPKLFL